MGTLELEVDGLVSDQGSIVVLSGLDNKGDCFWFGCDHRYAQDILSALENGEAPRVEVESWQIL